MAFNLDRYQELLTLPINAFNGLNKPDEVKHYECATIWKQSDRDNLLRYLEQAVDMREKELGYFLFPTYVTNELDMTLRNPHILKHKYLLALGQKAVADISIGETVDLLNINGTINDPVIFTLMTSLTDTSEIKIYKNDNYNRAFAVRPSYVNITAGTLTIHIPRGRLVKPELLDDREDHLDYYDDDNFVDEVDIIRQYTNPALAISYESPQCNSFTNHSQTGYGRVRDYKLATIETYPALWSLGTATPITYCLFNSSTGVLTSYLSGKTEDNTLDFQTIRMAHTLMPYKPIDCEPVSQYWLNDTVRDLSNITTPYGSSVAAVAVWIADSRSRIGFGTAVGGMG